MNWMIGGVYGDLYRIAMGDRREGAQLDEWEIERRMGEANTHSSSQDGRYWHRVATFAKRICSVVSLVRAPAPDVAQNAEDDSAAAHQTRRRRIAMWYPNIDERTFLRLQSVEFRHQHRGSSGQSLNHPGQSILRAVTILSGYLRRTLRVRRDEKAVAASTFPRSG